MNTLQRFLQPITLLVICLTVLTFLSISPVILEVSADPSHANATSVPPYPAPLPDLLVSDLHLAQDRIPAEPQAAELSYVLENQGTAPSHMGVTTIYLSTDPHFDLSDDRIVAIDYLTTIVLQPKQSFTSTLSLNLIAIYPYGPRYLIIVADSNQYVHESNEQNNILISKAPIEVIAPNNPLYERKSP
jgi:hypothetical protein